MDDRYAQSRLRTAIAILLLVLTLMLSIAFSVVAQAAPGAPGTSAPPPSCSPDDVDAPCPSGLSGPAPLSGTITWSEVQDDPGGLGSGVTQDASITLDMVWHPNERIYVPRTGTYAYDYEMTGHCTGSVAGSGVLSTEPYAGAEPGIATVTAEAFGPAIEDLVVKVRIWRDDYTQHCAATPGFDAFDTLDPGGTVQPVCIRVLGTPDNGPTPSYALSCVDQQIPGVHTIVDGVLRQVP